MVDSLAAYRANGSNLQPAGLIAPAALQLFPLYVLALLKQVGALSPTDTQHTSILSVFLCMCVCVCLYVCVCEVMFELAELAFVSL